MRGGVMNFLPFETRPNVQPLGKRRAPVDPGTADTIVHRKPAHTRKRWRARITICGDRNPLHYDAERAARTRFGGIVVQGGITSAILNAVVAEDLPGPGTVFLNVNWNFKAPVRPGDVITGQVEITRVRHDKPITELLTRVVRGDGTVALEGTAVCYTVPMAA